MNFAARMVAVYKYNRNQRYKKNLAWLI